jgi:hypothetical protein
MLTIGQIIRGQILHSRNDVGLIVLHPLPKITCSDICLKEADVLASIEFRLLLKHLSAHEESTNMLTVPIGLRQIGIFALKEKDRGEERPQAVVVSTESVVLDCLVEGPQPSAALGVSELSRAIREQLDEVIESVPGYLHDQPPPADDSCDRLGQERGGQPHSRGCSGQSPAAASILE